MFGPLLSANETEAQVGFLFHVMIGVNPFGVFRSVSGIGRTVDAEEIREGGRNHSPHLRVGHAKYQQCKIEWGLTYSSALYDWIHAVEAGYAYKRQVTVVQFDRKYTPLRIYMLWDAWPLSWEGARLNANDNAIDTEEITLAYEAVTLIPVPTEVSWTMPFTPIGDLVSDPVALEDSEEIVADHHQDSREVEGGEPVDHEAETRTVEAGVPIEHNSPTNPAEKLITFNRRDFVRDPEFTSPGRPAEDPTARTWEDPEAGEAREAVASRAAEDPTAPATSATESGGARDPADSRAAEAAASADRAALSTPDYGDNAVGRASFPVIAFSSGNFFTHEAQTVKLSSGVFLEPTVWEDLDLGGGA